ncbi:hypothetical protein, partial [Methylicorpusculum sp.]|uniref:hypothetical protein n=1 Tax=Methylicorpusculum sp. TaxID=2713644 RepID=UPI002ABAC242
DDYDIDLLSLFAQQGVSLTSLDGRGRKPGDILVERIKAHNYAEESGFCCCATAQDALAITLAKKVQVLGKYKALDVANITSLRELERENRVKSALNCACRGCSYKGDNFRDGSLGAFLGCGVGVGLTTMAGIAFACSKYMDYIDNQENRECCAEYVIPFGVMGIPFCVCGAVALCCDKNCDHGSCSCAPSPYAQSPQLKHAVQRAVPMPQQMLSDIVVSGQQPEEEHHKKCSMRDSKVVLKPSLLTRTKEEHTLGEIGQASTSQASTSRVLLTDGTNHNIGCPPPVYPVGDSLASYAQIAPPPYTPSASARD